MLGVDSILDSMYQNTGKSWKIAADSIDQQKKYQELSLEAAEKQKGEMEKDKTDTEIIVKPDGSRVLVVTVNVGGMQSTMSMEISKPTMLQGDISRQRLEDSHLLQSEDSGITE